MLIFSFRINPLGLSVALLLFISTATTVNAQCNVLNNTSIKKAVDAWININTRSEAQTTYGGPISQWNVSCCTDFKNLFRFSSGFQEDLTAWQTSQVQHMDWLFEVASDFAGDVSTWDVSNVVSMNRIFQRSSNFDATATGVSNWKTESLQDLRYGFANSMGFRGNLSGWDLSQVQDFDHLFSESFSFLADVSDWDLSQVTSMDHVFQLSDSFQGRVSGWKLSSALKSIRYGFSEVKQFSPLDNEGNETSLEWNTEGVTDMSFLMQGAVDFNSDCIASWNTPSLTTMPLAFAKSKNLYGTVESSWSTSKVESFANLFATTNNFTSPFAASFDVSSATNMNALFKYSRGFAADVSRWTTSNVKTMEEFAYDSTDFQADISLWDVSKVTSLQEAFHGVKNFPVSLLDQWTTTSIKNMRWIFDDAEWSTKEGAPDPYPICWAVGTAFEFDLERISCKSPSIGLDCECIDYELAEIINIKCGDVPPCIGVVPVEEWDDDSESADTAVVEPASGSPSWSWRGSVAVLLALVSMLS